MFFDWWQTYWVIKQFSNQSKLWYVRSKWGNSEQWRQSNFRHCTVEMWVWQTNETNCLNTVFLTLILSHAVGGTEWCQWSRPAQMKNYCLLNYCAIDLDARRRLLIDEHHLMAPFNIRNNSKMYTYMQWKWSTATIQLCQIINKNRLIKTELGGFRFEFVVVFFFFISSSCDLLNKWIL